MSGGSLTRILNNQIYNQTIIASQKIQPGSIVGSLFASNVTVPGDLLIAGNLFVLGNSVQTTISSTNTYVNDPLLTLNNGFTGTNTYDEGFIFNRGSATNAGFFWSEYFKEFRLVYTSETGTTYGNINATGLAPLSIGSLNVPGAANIGSLSLSGGITAASLNVSGNVLASTVGASYVTASTLTVGNIAAVNFGNTGAIFTGASLNVSGNVDASTVLAQLLTGSTATFGNVAAGLIGNIGTAYTGASINLSGNVLASTVLASYVTASTATFGNISANTIGNASATINAGFVNVSGNVDASTVLASYVTASTATFGNISAVTIGNAGATVTGTTAAFSGNVIGGLAQFASINATPVGNASASTGAFTTLSAANNLWANASIATTTQGTGAIVVPNGGISVSGAANVGSTLTVAGATQLNSTLGVGGVTSITNTTNATGQSTGALQVAGGASFTQDVWIGGNLFVSNIVGVTANVITVTDPLVYFKNSNIAGYNYDIGFYSAFTGTGLGTVNQTQYTAVFRDLTDNTWKFASNVAAPGPSIITLDSNTIYDPIKAGNLNLVNTTASTTTGTGALIVAGGAGIGGTVVAAQLNSTGNVLGQNGIFNALTINGALGITGNVIGGLAQFSAINSTPIGNATSSTGAFTTLSASASFYANSTTASTNTSTGALIVGGGAGIGGNIFQSGAYHDSSSSNFIMMPTPTAANIFSAATTIFYGAAAGDFTIRNPNINSVQATLNLFRGNVTTLNFATSATTISVGAATGTTTLNSATNGATYRAGALVVSGGIGVNGNLNLSQNNVITLGADLVSNVVYPENVVQITTTANNSSRISIQNTNTGLLATSEFNAISSNGSNVAGYISIGIAGQNYLSASATIIKPQDGYTYTSTGNLVLSSTKDLVLSTSGSQSVGVRISGTFANVGVQYTTAATSSTTGALTSVGGISTQSNLYVSKGATINTDNGTEAFTVKSNKVGNVAIYANVIGTTGTSTTESVIIGGGNLTLQPGAILKVSGQTSMMVPVGPSAARPSSQGGNDVQGMIRFNSTTNALEYYDGTAWQIAGSVFTVISDRQFQGNTAGGYGNVDGTNTTFTIQANATSSSTLVAINGVMQFPTLAYSVSGTVLTFTEPPAPGDVIDVRVLTTTSTVSSITNGNGINQFIADDTGVSQWSGTSGSGTVERTLVDTAGNFNLLNGTHLTYTQGNVNIPATATAYKIDSFSQVAYSTAKYIIQSRVGSTNFESYEALATTDGQGNAYIAVYGIVNNGTSFGTITANVLAGNVNVYYTSTIAQANVKAFGTYIV